MPVKPKDIDLESFNRLVSAIYDAAMDTALWPRFMQNCAHAFHAHGMLLRTQDLQKKEICSYFTYGLDPSFQQKYADHFIHHDPVISSISQLEPGTLTQTAQLFPAEIYRKTEYFNDYIIPQGTEQIAGGMIARDGSRIAIFGLHRTDRIDHFTSGEMETLQLLVPHLQRAIDMNRHLIQLTSHTGAANNIVDRLHTGVIMVNSRGKPCFINKKAESLIADGCGIRAGQKGIQLPRHEDTVWLQKLIFNASRLTPRTGGTLVVANPSSLQPLSILVAPINKDNYFHFGVDPFIITAVLFIDNQESHSYDFSSDVISNLYGLTYAEARLSAALANGFNLEEIAAKYHVSKATLRTQLKACFQKTGVNRQAELVKLILGGPAAMVTRDGPEKNSDV